MNKKFIIKYKILLEDADSIDNKEIKISNCISSFHAQARLEEYLEKKYINFRQLIVYECREDWDINNIFGDMFGDDVDLGKFFGGK